MKVVYELFAKIYISLFLFHERKDEVGVECLHVLKDLSDFVLVLDLRCYTLYFTINNLANLNFILATKVNRGWILVCLPLSDNFF